jgi:hypothetical protein
VGDGAEVFDTLEEEPLLEDVSRGDFRLRDGSPAVDAGTARLAPARDLEGRVRTTDAPDIGAYERD